MTRTWGLFVRVREKRLPVAVPWHPADQQLFRFDVPEADPLLSRSLWVPDGYVPSPWEPGVLVRYRDDGFR